MGLPKLEIPFWGPFRKNYGILESILSPSFLEPTMCSVRWFSGTCKARVFTSGRARS